MSQAVVEASPGLRPTWAEIDLGAIRHNIRAIAGAIGPQRRVMAVVKSDAYGHGMVPVAKASLDAGAAAFGVATSDEGLTLRETAGFENAFILVMAPTTEAEIEALQAANLSFAVGSVDLLRAHLRVGRRRGKLPRIHMQLDTGIGRDGVRHDDLEFLDVLAAEGATIEGLFTHFAVADGLSDDEIAFTKLQFERFQNGARRVREAGHRPTVHCANSGAILRHREMFCDMVRPGMMTYGVDPAGFVKAAMELRPALSFKSRLAAVKWMEPGDTISYGRLWTVPSRRRIAIVPVGYGDGYIRSFSNKGTVLVRGKRVPIRGRVCMDQFMVDLAEVPEAQLGDEVVLYGEQHGTRLSLEEVAETAGTIPYELGCILTRRVPRVWRD